jgi:hypothetical protein
MLFGFVSVTYESYFRRSLNSDLSRRPEHAKILYTKPNIDHIKI